MHETSRSPAPFGSEIQGKEGTYALGSIFARGQAGTIYGAKHLESGHQVAIKVSEAPDPHQDPRFFREIEFLKTARHPNIVRMIDEGSFIDGRPMLVMELLGTETLQSQLDKQGQIELAAVRDLGLQVARGLAYLHDMGLLHRDIKPSNLAWEAPGGTPLVKIMDFGLVGPAREKRGNAFYRPSTTSDLAEQFNTLTTEQSLVGTPAYMSPQQVEGVACNSACDVYAWGVVVYEMLAGRLPFEGSIVDILRAHLNKEPEPLDESLAPTEFRNLIMLCLSKPIDPRPSAQELIAHLIG